MSRLREERDDARLNAARLSDCLFQMQEAAKDLVAQRDAAFAAGWSACREAAARVVEAKGRDECSPSGVADAVRALTPPADAKTKEEP